MQSYNDSTGKNKQTSKCYQSAWMAHWTGNASAEVRNPRPNDRKELDLVNRQQGSFMGLDDPRSVKGLGRVEARNLDQSQRMSLGNLENEKLRCESFLDGNRCLTDVNGSTSKFDDILAVRAESCHNLEHGTVAECTSRIQSANMPLDVSTLDVTSSRGSRSVPGGTLKKPDVQMRASSFARGSSSAVSKPLKDKNAAASSHIVPYRPDLTKHEIDKGKNKISSAIVSNGELPNSNLEKLKRENGSSFFQPASLFHGRKLGAHSQAGKLIHACSRKANVPLLDAPAKEDKPLPAFAGDWLQKMQKFSGIVSEKSESEKSNHGCHSWQKNQDCVCDVETMTTLPTVDSVEGLPGNCPRFSQITQGLLITRKTYSNPSKENDIFGNARALTEPNDDTSRAFHSLTPFHSQGRVKLQSLGSSADTRGKEKIGDIKASKIIIRNESSADTDTMDMDCFRENNNLAGARSTPSNKVNKVNSSLPPCINVTSSRKVGHRGPNNTLTQINLELPAWQAAASSTDNAELSSSMTQTLDMNVLLAHVQQPCNRSSNPCPDGSPISNPSNRWVKRLRLSSSGSSAHGTKSLSLNNNLSHGKAYKLFGETLKDSTTSSEPTVSKHQSMVPDETKDLPRQDENFFPDLWSKQGKDLLLSHSWIQRWRHYGSKASEEGSESVVISGPQSSKLPMEDLQEKQFPSIAAMALMSKAMSGFQPCQLQKKGSFIVWNTKAY